MLRFVGTQGVGDYADVKIDRDCHAGNRRNAVLRGSIEFRADGITNAVANRAAANANAATSNAIANCAAEPFAHGCSADGTTGEHASAGNPDVGTRSSAPHRHIPRHM